MANVALAQALRLFACEALDVWGEGQGEPAVLLAGVQERHIRVSVWRAGAEVASEVLPFGPDERDRRSKHGVVRLSPMTWAAWGEQGVGENRRFCFSMRKWRDGKFVEIVDPSITKEMSGWPKGVCAGSDGRVALFYSEDHVSAKIRTFEADGSIAEPLNIRPTEGRGEQDDSEEYWAENYIDATPVVWHDRLGLIVDHDCSAFSIRPAPEALPQDLPTAWWKLPTFDVPRRGHRIAGGRVLLLYGGFGIVVENNDPPTYAPFDGVALTPVGLDALDRPPWRPTRVEQALPDGSVVIEKMARFEWERVQQTCRLTPDGITVSEEPSPVPQPAVLMNRGFRAGECVGSDGSRYDISDTTVSIPTVDGTVDLSAHRLSAAFEGEPPNQHQSLKILFSSWLDSMILDLCRTQDGWRLLGGRIDERERSHVWLCSLIISANGMELRREASPRKVVRQEQVLCCCALGAGLAALGYASGRIEILALNEESPRVLAVGFTLTPPDDLAVSNGRPAGRRLVVIAGDVVWFDLGRPV